MAEALKGIKAANLTEWLAANIRGAKPPFAFELITGGHSNLTYRVTDAEGTRRVLRRPPTGAVLATAHDMGREHKIITGVGKTSVPVPPALGLCTDESVNDAPFYIMGYVDGVVLDTGEITGETLPDGATRRKLGERVIDVLVDLHRVNPDAVGLGDLGRKEGYLDRQLKRWRGQWEKSKTRELPAMEQTYELLLQAKPEQKHTGIVHGDYRLGNMLSTPQGDVAAVLDWELCTLGDVLADVGYILNNWAQPGEAAAGRAPGPTTVGGFQTREELVERYSEKSGFAVENADYYRSFQHWRLSAISEGVLNRYQKGVMADRNADLAGMKIGVDRMAAEALRLIRSLQ